MNADFLEALTLLERDKGIPKEYMKEKIMQALATAYRRSVGGQHDELAVEIDEASGEIRMYMVKTAVEEVTNPQIEIALADALADDPALEAGDKVRYEVKTRDFGRIAAQTAKQVIIQGIREAERGIIFQSFTSREHEILTATVVRSDGPGGNVTLEIGAGQEKTEVILPPGEQVPGEDLRDGSRVKVYVVEVRKSARGPQVLISRSHPGLVKRLFELEVPEISDGIVEIRGIARMAGGRTKMAVWSGDENIDAVGACIGPRNERVSSVMNELGGEKIDIIPFSEDPGAYIAAALGPAKVLAVAILPEGRACRVTVPDDQLSLAIGREGQNARLAAKITGYKIDIKPESAGL